MRNKKLILIIIAALAVFCFLLIETRFFESRLGMWVLAVIILGGSLLSGIGSGED